MNRLLQCVVSPVLVRNRVSILVVLVSNRIWLLRSSPELGAVFFVDIFSVNDFRTTVRLLFLLSLAWLTETARTLLNMNKVTLVKDYNFTELFHRPVTSIANQVFDEL